MNTTHTFAQAPEGVTEFLQQPAPMWIAGQPCQARSKKTETLIDPATGRAIASTAVGGVDEIDAAVQAARKAFSQRSWRNLPPAERTRLLWRLAELIQADSNELAYLETLNQGMPLSTSQFVMGHVLPDMLQYAAGWATKIEGSTGRLSIPDERMGSPWGAPYHSYTVREPVGVVGAIIPWNMPLLMAIAKIGPAIAAGCTMVIKPAIETPLTAAWLGKLIVKAGFPAGVINLVQGSGPEAGAALAEHPEINMITFTGSTQVGRELTGMAGRTMKRIALELGGKSPVIIFDDADLERAVAVSAEGIAFNAGQICFAGTRLLVDRKIADEVTMRLASYLGEMKVGHGLEANTQLGPLTSERQLHRVQGFVDEARAHPGIKIISGGQPCPGPGWFYPPTVLRVEDHSAPILNQEVFGPVITVSSFDDPADLPRLANAGDYGLAASIWTRNLALGHALAAEIQAGTICINSGMSLDDSMPNGGFKSSGWGREGGRIGVESYTELKSVVAAL